MVRERCSCGAEFESDDDSAVKMLREWRRKHKCVPPVTGDRPGLSVTSDMTPTDNRESELHIGFRPSYDE
jgi:hypothetical protein